MSKKLLFGDVAECGALIEALSKFPCISRLDDASHLEAEYLVHDFSDLEESFHKLLDELFPKVKQHAALTNEEMEDLLWNIRSEMEHIHYHLTNARSNRDVCPATAEPVDDATDPREPRTQPTNDP
jgi:hypothetical protein